MRSLLRPCRSVHRQNVKRRIWWRNNTSVGHSMTLNPMHHASRDRKTSIVCTVGPSTSDRESLKGLLDEGMNCLRLNFSHGDHEQKVRERREGRGLAVPKSLSLESEAVFLTHEDILSLFRPYPTSLAAGVDPLSSRGVG